MATTRFIDIRVRSRSAERNVDRLDNRMKGLGRTADNTVTSFSNLTRIAAGIGTALASNQILRYADAFTSVQNQIRQTTNTTQALTQRTNELFESANRSRTSVSALSDSYTQLTLSTEALNLSDQRRLAITETIGKSFTLSGISIDKASESTRQLNQAFSSGVLRGQEYNTIIENAPEIFRALQRSTGQTAGQLRLLADTGQLTSDVLIKALEGAAETIDRKFNASTVTFAQNLEIANNNLTAIHVGSSQSQYNLQHLQQGRRWYH